MCFRIGSCRLYAPMVPLAPHPCVRWWNTKEITLKLPRKKRFWTPKKKR